MPGICQAISIAMDATQAEHHLSKQKLIKNWRGTKPIHAKASIYSIDILESQEDNALQIHMSSMSPVQVNKQCHASKILICPCLAEANSWQASSSPYKQ